MLSKIFKVGLFAILVFTMISPDAFAAAAKKDSKKEESLGINNETLSAGVMHEEGMYLPRGMEIPCTLRTPIDTRVNKEGDTVTLQTTQDVMIGDYTLIPANSFIHGYITELVPPKSMHRRPKLELAFDTVSLKGENSQDRKYIKLHGTIKNKDLLAKAERVNDNGLYKQKARKAAAVGAVAGGLTSYAVVEYMTPFSMWGIEGLANNIFMAGSGLAGAYLAAGLITKDDVRLEPGAELTMMLDEPTVELYQNAQPMLAMNPEIKSLPVGEAYDKMTTMESETLKGVKVKH